MKTIVSLLLVFALCGRIAYSQQPQGSVGDARSVLQAGDMVVVVNDGAKLMAGDTVTAVLKKGTEVRVAKVSGRWIAVDTVVNGARTIGWVGISDLKRVPAQAAPKAGTVVPPGKAATNATDVASYRAGGRLLAIPTPTRNLVEIGSDHHALMEVFVPPENRLVAAFVLDTDLPRLRKGGNVPVMSAYAMAQVPRRGEFLDCGVSEFAKVVGGAKEQFGTVVASSFKEAEEEFNRRMKSLNLDKVTISLGKPIQLGCIFSKQDAYGFGMIMPVSMGGSTATMGGGCALIRAKKRLLFVYLYTEYKNEETVRWLRKATEEWTDAILKANNE